MENKKVKNIIIKTGIIAMLLSMTACKSNGNGAVDKNADNKSVDTTTSSLIEETDLPQYELYLESLKKEDEFKLLKQGKVSYGREYDTEDEIIDALLGYLNDWDAAGVASVVGTNNYDELGLYLPRYSDSIQEEWNKIKGSVTCKKTGSTFSENDNTLVEYEFTFDMQENGPLNFNKGKNIRYYYINLSKYDTTITANATSCFRDENDRLNEYDEDILDDIHCKCKSNFGLSTSDEYYYEKMQEDNFVLKMDYNRDYKIDLDGDGQDEVLSMNLSQYSKDLTEKNDSLIYTNEVHNIVVNGNIQEHLCLYSAECNGGNYDNDRFYLVDIDNTDEYIEIAIGFSGYGGYDYVEPEINFYRYIDGKVSPIGSVPFGKSSVNEECDIRICSNGVIEQYKLLDSNSYVRGKCKYIYSETNKTIEQKSKWCYYTSKYKQTLLEDYAAYELPEDNAKAVSINKGDEITFLATNLNDWYWCENSDGTRFFMKHDDNTFFNNK